MKKLIALLLCVCLLLSAAACTNAPAVGKSTDASNQDGEQRLRIVATLQSQQINFWSNVQHTLERLAKEENVDLTIMDLNGDVTTFANVIDDIVAMKPDGVITCGLETSTLGIHVKTLQDAGIPVVTYNISPEGATCPQVVADQSEFGRVAGTAAAEYWKENHPDTTPVGGAVDLYSAPQCKERVDGFVEGDQRHVRHQRRQRARRSGCSARDQSRHVRRFPCRQRRRDGGRLCRAEGSELRPEGRCGQLSAHYGRDGVEPPDAGHSRRASCQRGLSAVA